MAGYGFAAIEKKWQDLQDKATPTTDAAKADFQKAKDQMAQALADAKAKLIEAKDAGADAWQKNVKPALPEDLASLIKRAASLQVHLKDHKKDLSNKRGLQLIESRIRRLSKYYKEEGVLPSDWDYSAKLAELQVK